MFFQNGSKYLAEEIEYLCKLMYETLKIPIYFLDNNYDIFISFSHGYSNPLYSDKKDFFMQLFNDINLYDFPIIKSTKYQDNYLAVKLNIDDIFIGIFILGPSIYSIIPAETIDELIDKNNIQLNRKRDLINFYNSILTVDYTRLINIGSLLYYSIYNRRLDTAAVIEKNSSLKDITVLVNNKNQNSISKNRQEIVFHHSPEHEKNIMRCIKEGNRERLMQVLDTPMDGNFGILSKNSPLRNQRNLVICAITVATRAAIEGGVDSEIAYTLSDSYIQIIEEIDSIKDLMDIYNKSLHNFAEIVCQAKALKYPEVILKCQSYIFKHLYENISVSELAKAVNLNANYLSELFKRSTGTTISEYIQKEKVEEAKRLLKSSTHSILDIYTWLGFHDQSHFTRVFKKHAGMTPKKYRDIAVES